VASAFLELLTMRAVVKPFARRSDPLASGYDGGMANHSDKFAATTDLCPDDSKAVLCVLIGDALDHAGERGGARETMAARKSKSRVKPIAASENPGNFKKGYDPRRQPGGILNNKSARELVMLARDHGPSSVAKIVAIRDDPQSPRAVALNAAIALLDRGYGRPHQSVALAALPAPELHSINDQMTPQEALLAYQATVGHGPLSEDDGSTMVAEDHGDAPIIDVEATVVDESPTD
jgi:hypothetical protein